jgi:hypothetical protein
MPDPTHSAPTDCLPTWCVNQAGFIGTLTPLNGGSHFNITMKGDTAMIQEITSAIRQLEKLSDQLEEEERISAAYARGYIGEITSHLRQTVEDHEHHRIGTMMSVHEGRSKLL